MSIFKDFIINNFILFCVASVLIPVCIIRFKQHRRISTYMIFLMTNTILIAIAVFLTNLFEDMRSVPGTTVFSMLGYSLRPICIFFIIMMTGKINTKSKWFPLLVVPFAINILVYSLMLFPFSKELVVYYSIADNGEVYFFDGKITILRYFSHIISGLYIIYVVYISLARISAKHIGHGLTILSCVFFVILAVVIESFFNDEGDIELLNNTIAVSGLVYYLYLYIERTQIDTLTGLFNRETYYHDVQKMGRSVTGVIQFDMNGLKYINDNFGHLEGDKALSIIADVISKAAKSNMYVYRLGGDEYIILCHNGTEEDIIQTVAAFKEGMSKTTYYCSYGYSYRKNNKNASVEDLLKEAEEKMYQDKERFYKNSSFERRKAEIDA